MKQGLHRISSQIGRRVFSPSEENGTLFLDKWRGPRLNLPSFQSYGVASNKKWNNTVYTQSHVGNESYEQRCIISTRCRPSFLWLWSSGDLLIPQRGRNPIPEEWTVKCCCFKRFCHSNTALADLYTVAVVLSMNATESKASLNVQTLFANRFTLSFNKKDNHARYKTCYMKHTFNKCLHIIVLI